MKRLPAFSLIEIAIGLFIMGLLLMAVMKGGKLIDTAKIHTCVQQIAEIKRDFENFLDQHMPDAINLTDFKLASNRSQLGGKFKIDMKDGQYVLVLNDGNGKGVLSPSQAVGIQRYFPQTQVEGCDLSGSQNTCQLFIPIGS